MVPSRAIEVDLHPNFTPRRAKMRKHLKAAALALTLFAVPGVLANLAVPAAYAQSNISGDLTGTVTDPSGAVLANAAVTVTSDTNGQVKTVSTDAQGNWRVPLLSPGKYKVSITAPGFETTTLEAQISAGVNTPLITKLTVGQGSSTVEVSGSEVQLLHTDDAQISTTFDQQQIQSLPNPGNDLTFVAQTAPGAVMNTQGGYGNFSTNGLPATSNTFTVNGGYEGDPYLNLNNSGATNLLLGNNDVDQVTVTTNAYDAAFGGLGGAQVNEISRSGSNKWHGNAVYWWNGRAMNANSYINKLFGSPRNFDNANQWAAAVGGPLKKDKIFGFIDYEGIRVIIPNNGTVYAPSPAYQAAIFAAPTGYTITAPCDPTKTTCSPYTPYGNLADNGLSSETSMYQTIFGYYNNAKNYSSGTQDVDPDSWIFNGQTTNFGREWLINDRADFNLSASDHLFIHSKVDHGVQPTQTSFLNPVFNAQSPQPSYEGQLSETHTFSPFLTNQFLFAASYYRAIFVNTQQSTLAGTLPFVLRPEGFVGGGDWDALQNSSGWVGGVDYAFPQGRNVTGYQFGDDVSLTKGKHTWKVGFTMRRDDISDYTASERNIATAGGEGFVYDQGNFAAGYIDRWEERFAKQLANPVALYVMGAYVQDQWKPLPNLVLTAGLRLEHNSNPKCNTNCVSNFSTDFSNLSAASTTPYDTLITTNRKRAFFSQQNVAYEPRIGFSYQPGGSGSKTTIRGGFGMFADYFPAQIMGSLLANSPTTNTFLVNGAYYGFATPLEPGLEGSGHALAVTSNAAFTSTFPTGGNYSSLYASTGHAFRRPNFTSVAHKVYLPSYEEWSLAVEREVIKHTVLSVTYVGNHGYHEPVARLPNAYDPYGDNATLPSALPNKSFLSVTEYYSGASSNFNGLIATVTSRQKWLTEQFNYAYGHALDESSNGGFDAFGVNQSGQINPYDLTQNYGNADYDTRHYISANYAINVPYWGGPRMLTDGWELSGTVFHNTGYPFSVLDDSGHITYGNYALARQTGVHFNHKCGGGSHWTTPCDFAAHFRPSTNYGQQRRNQLWGPNYTDADVDLAKSFKIIPHSETAKLKIGAQFFNAFNHGNFQIPDAGVQDGSSFGKIYTSANTPTSILGAFLGGDASPRLIQFKGTFVF